MRQYIVSEEILKEIVKNSYMEGCMFSKIETMKMLISSKIVTPEMIDEVEKFISLAEEQLPNYALLTKMQLKNIEIYD